jgi:mannitol 2-dehydrogenase
MAPLKLNLANLPAISGVAKPAYARGQLLPGIVHIGVGNFHRAHQAHYLHRLFDKGVDRDWAIVGAGIKAGDRIMRERLLAQDCLSTIVELDPAGLTATICGAMTGFAACEPASVIDALTRPEIRIASLTITEGGYFLDAKSGGFRIDDSEIAADVATPGQPGTVFGILVEALRRRRAAGLAPFSVLSCDNLPGNGHATAQAVVGLATAQARELGVWIEDKVAFPNGMVDCITPATTDSERAMVAEKFGIEDAAPVICEPFRQWVLEDDFTCGRPRLEEAGVEFVADVAPYELMKLRILNGGHAALAYASALLGLRLVYEAMEHPLIRAWFEKLEHDEIIPSVPPVPGVDLNAYLRVVAERFANPAVGDTIPRLCLDGSNRQPKFILPIVRDRLAARLPVDGLALEVALWARYCAGHDELGNPIPIPDERARQLNAKALQAKTEPLEFLWQPEIFGDLAHPGPFADRYSFWLATLWRDGVTRTLDSYSRLVVE